MSNSIEELNFIEKMVSAGTAACSADLITFPLDVAKVRLQIASTSVTVPLMANNSTQYRGLFGTLIGMVTNEGPKSLYGGIVPGLQRQCVLASIRVGLYEPVKDMYTDYLGADGSASKTMFIRIISAITTGTIGNCFAQPTDVVKVRMQAQCRGTGRILYHNSRQAYQMIYRYEGFAGLWKGFIPNIIRNSVVNVAELVCYDTIKEVLINNRVFNDGLLCHFSAGLAAGFCATLLTSPIDVVKTRYMNSRGQYSGVIHCATTLAKEGGFLGFYKGFTPAFMRLGTWNVCMFMAFEQIKILVLKMKNEQDNNKHNFTSLRTKEKI